MIKTIAYGVVGLVMLDLLILVTALAQIAVEGRTGLWNDFWLWQARVLLGL